MRRIYILAIALLCALPSVMAQQTISYEGADETVRLWDNTTAKYSNYETRDEAWNNKRKTSMKHTSSCELYIFKAKPEKNTGIAVAIYPGGGYTRLNLNVSMAKWYAENGITAAIVKYRTPNFGHTEAIMEDAAGAVRYLRTRTDLGIDPAKIGVTGSSAGGHLSAWVSNAMADDEKPAFAIPIYPWIDLTISSSNTEGKALFQTLGKDYTIQDAADLSLHTKVGPTTPPTLIFLCHDDSIVLSLSSTKYYEALARHGVKASMHIFPRGGHSMKLHTEEQRAATLDWLNWLGLLK